MTPQSRLRLALKVVLLGLATAAVLASGAGVALAAAGSPRSAATPGSSFIDNLAAILHLTPAQTRSDLKQAELRTIDQMVKDGRLTPAQGQALKQRIEAGGDLPPFAFGPPEGGFGTEFALHRQLAQAEMAAAAKTLGLSESSFEAQLRSGKSITDLEHAKGVSDATLRAALVAAARRVLNPAEKSGQITGAEANAILQRIQSDGWGPGDGWHPRPGRDGGPDGPDGPGGPGPAAPASA